MSVAAPEGKEMPPSLPLETARRHHPPEGGEFQGLLLTHVSRRVEANCAFCFADTHRPPALRRPCLPATGTLALLALLSPQPWLGGACHSSYRHCDFSPSGRTDRQTGKVHTNSTSILLFRNTLNIRVSQGAVIGCFTTWANKSARHFCHVAIAGRRRSHLMESFASGGGAGGKGIPLGGILHFSLCV